MTTIANNNVQPAFKSYVATPDLWNHPTSDNKAIKVAQKIAIAVATFFVAIAETVYLAFAGAAYLGISAANALIEKFGQKKVTDENKTIVFKNPAAEVFSGTKAEPETVMPKVADIDETAPPRVIIAKEAPVAETVAAPVVAEEAVVAPVVAEEAVAETAPIATPTVAPQSIFSKTMSFIGNHKKVAGAVALTAVLGGAGYVMFPASVATGVISAATHNFPMCLANATTNVLNGQCLPILARNVSTIVLSV